MAENAEIDTLIKLVSIGDATARQDLLKRFATLRAQLAEAQASERERCALALQSIPPLDPNFHVFIRTGFERGLDAAAVAIRALSPTPNLEKPE